MKNKEEIKQILASLEEQSKDFKNKVQTKASPDTVCAEDYQYLSKCCDNLYEMIYRLRDYIYQSDAEIWNALYDHKNNGHIPPIKGTEKMEKALKVLGIDKDYEILKPVIYSTASKNGSKSFEVNLNIKKNV